MHTVIEHDADFVPFDSGRAQTYLDAGLWRETTLPDVFTSWVHRFGSRRAVVDECRSEALTYDELHMRVLTTAAGFADRGIEPGDRVVVQLPNSVSFAVVLFALLECGAVPVLTLPAHRRREIVHLAATSKAVAYVIAERDGNFDYRALADETVDSVPTVRDVFVDGSCDSSGSHSPLSAVVGAPREFPRASAADIAVLLVSGGTTGLPKLIPRTHNDYEFNARASAEVCELTPEDVYLAVLPAAHNFPLACPGLLGALGVGATVVFSRSASPDQVFALIEKYRVTVTALVPTLTHLWCEATEWEEADLSSLRLLQVGGAKLTPEVAKLVEPALGCRLQQVFGMAEGLLNYTRAGDGPDVVIGTQGRPLSEFDEIRIVDADGNDVPAGDVGELLTRGPYTINGYYAAAEHNTTAITPDGFYRSGDQVRALPSGHLVVTGRIKDVITRNGENVAADELEDLLLTHHGVARVAVIGVPDPAVGESICAVIVPNGSARNDSVPTVAEVRAFLTDAGCAGFKLPDRVVARTSLPVTAIGKVDKALLVRQSAERQASR
ncbi:(2,3-dihydroxybenzoyl)adenylate synthase [Rhodococcus sp. IEGM 1330]|uniref:(2,3-dihydroxybenzoyl)adenylate synthase n=1 Tax=Rhodococcus sp. IEGM 1330 TaxID=3082225 RepID=UPI00295309FD|nr:AMP-binding protein [Rhodococcus sp. IEGM 1330]MDV8022894.1 AMP-binding protein [Rhodococcus sp. IEGM 1330]